MGTNVPAPAFGPQGFQPPQDAAVLSGVQADFKVAFGSGINFSASNGSAQNATPQGQLANSLTSIISAANAQFVNLTNQVNPAFAEGRMQDAIGYIYFLQRYPAQGTVVSCVCTGAVGTIIPGGTVGTAPTVMAQDDAGNQYTCVQGGTIPAGGSLTLDFVNVIPGPTLCLPNTLTTIYQTIPGWDSITNPTAGVPGNDAESRSAFETRRKSTVEANSQGPIGAIIGAVSNTPGVLDYYGFSNNKASPVTQLGVTIPAYSMYVCVEGGTDADVAQSIFSKLPPGPPMTGNTTATAYDSNPLYVAPIPYSITFNRPTDLSITFSVVIQNGPDVPANAATLVQNAILSAFAGLDGGARARIASLILASRYYGPVSLIGAWCNILSLQVGSTNVPDSIFAARIVGQTLTVVSTTSGAIVIGGTISDPTGRVAEGTRITSGAGSTWQVSIPQTVAGASFTGTAGSPATRLVAASVTGTIRVGDTVNGTGIVNGTTILSQLSGTTGGAGTYILSANNTASSAACTSDATVTSASSNDNSQQVQADQVPVTDANLIYVQVS